jgi:hypothetical protein
MFDNVINEDVVNNLSDETLNELLAMFEKAGY